MNQKLKHKLWLDNLLVTVSEEELRNYYFSHRKSETCEHFNLPNSAISYLLKYYNIVKPKQAITKLREETCLDKYGYKNSSQCPEIKELREQTCLKKYGAKSNLATEQFKEQSRATCLEKYGTEFANQNKQVIQHIKDAKINKYGSLSKCYEHIVSQGKQTRIKNSGSLYNSYKAGLDNQSKIILEKYGVKYACMRPEARAYSNDSLPNKAFAKLLEENGYIYSKEHTNDVRYYSREFAIDNKSYDFKIGNILVEIDPFATHNSTWGIANNPKEKDYHLNKSQLATATGYFCLHVFDWDDLNKILDLLPKFNNTIIYGRQCEIKEVDIEETNLFLNLYHLQNTCKNQTVRLGLYYNGELVSIMTFGTPRYNKNYDYELLRLCTKANTVVIGGANKLFKHFITVYKPKNIISYCDLSKFSGKVYTNLNFIRLNNPVPSLHWYNEKSKKHITDNLLRQRGFDQLFGTNYGKGTSNQELMLNNGFVEIYDCGQATYIYK